MSLVGPVETYVSEQFGQKPSETYVSTGRTFTPSEAHPVETYVSEQFGQKPSETYVSTGGPYVEKTFPPNEHN